MKNKGMTDPDGIKIRRQYFNFFIMALFGAFLFFLIVNTVRLITVNYGIYDWWETMRNVISQTLCLLLPLGVLSVLNMLFFGEVICVISEEGLSYKGVFVRWEDVLYIEHRLLEHTKREHYPCYITLVCPEEKISVTSAPFFVCLFAKKYKSGIKIKPDKMLLFYFGCIIVGAALYLSGIVF